MRQWHPVVAAVVAAALLAPDAVAAGEPDLAAVDRFVAEYAEGAGYPGVAVAITRGDRVVHVAGYGRSSDGSAMTPATAAPVASVGKSFTALAVMQLVEQARVALDEPVADHLPDFRLADPRGAGITVRQLLNHTSGITDGTLPEKSLPQPNSSAEAVVRAHDATLAADPGAEHHYTNTNYHLAARLVEEVSGEPYADYLRRHVFEPAGMRSTTTITRAPGGVAKGHVYAYGASIPMAEPERFLVGSDDVITTADDMARWLVVQAGGGRAADGTRLLSPDGIKAMHTPSDPRWTYGMGWDTSDDGRVRHGGIWFTYSAGELLLPSGYGIAVMANSGIALGNEGTGRLEDGLAALLEGGVPEPAPRFRSIADLVLAALTAASLVLGVLAVRRSAAGWAPRRAPWRQVPRLLPRVVPLVVLVVSPHLAGPLAGGRDISHVQLAYFSPALVTWVLVSSVMNVSVLVTRVVALLKLRTPSQVAE